MKTLILFLLLSNAVFAEIPVPSIGKWSASVDGIRAHFILDDLPRAADGAEVMHLYVEFESIADSNVLTSIWYRPFRSQFVWTLRAPGGGTAPSTTMSGNEAGAPSHWVDVRGGSRTRVDVGILGVRERYPFESLHAPPYEPVEKRRGFDVTLGFQDWSIRTNLAAQYFLEATFESTRLPQDAAQAPAGKPWEGSLAIPGLAIPRTQKSNSGSREK
jgi:hypothetical protein